MISSWIRNFRGKLNAPVLKALEVDRPDAAVQQMLRLKYREYLQAGRPIPSFRDAGFKAYSQTDEDGILWLIFSVIGEKSRVAVEICAGNGIECNSANLIINHGWHGLLVDGQEKNIRIADDFYFPHFATRCFPPKLHCGWVDAENVNGIIRSHGFSGEIDLLTVDLDGMDYWVWKAIDVVRPRVVVAEYNTSMGPDRCCTVPYDPAFNGYDHSVTRGMPDYAGATLRAMIKLGEEKGFRFVGVNRLDFNAFFVREEEAAAFSSPEVSDCFSSSHAKWCISERGPKIDGLAWQDI